MRRREYLSAAAACATATALAGCSTTSDQYDAFKSRLEDNDVDIEAAGEEERRWVLEYVPTAGGQDARLSEFGEILRTYADTVPESSVDDDHRQLDIIILQTDGQRAGSASVSATRAREYRNGEISEEQYIIEVFAQTYG